MDEIINRILTPEGISGLVAVYGILRKAYAKREKKTAETVKKITLEFVKERAEYEQQLRLKDAIIQRQEEQLNAYSDRDKPQPLG